MRRFIVSSANEIISDIKKAREVQQRDICYNNNKYAIC